MNYAPGMPSLSGNQSHVAPRYPSVSGVGGQYEINNGYPVHNNIMQTQASSHPPGYNNYYGTLHSPPPISPVHTNQQQTRGPLSVSQHGIYNQSGDANDLEKRLNLLRTGNSQGGFESGLGFGSSEYIAPKLSSQYQDEMVNANVMPLGQLNKEEKQTISNGIGGVMNPIIENLVGSMSMCNGTYTHFGPSTAPVNKVTSEQNDIIGDFLIGRQNGKVDHDSRTMFSRIAVAPINKEHKESMKENGIGGIINPVRKQMVQVPDSQHNVCQENIVTKSAFTSADQSLGESRASSPRESLDTSSRPQTPGVRIKTQKCCLNLN